MSLADYFTDEALISALCRIRIKEAEKADKISKGFHSRLGQRFNHLTAPYLPQRRLWDRYRPRFRTTLSSNKTSEISLINATLKNRDSIQPWAANLTRLLARVRHRALESESFSFNPPRISAVLKKDNIYRPLASFELEDKLIDGALAKYWMHELDTLFEDSSSRKQ